MDNSVDKLVNIIHEQNEEHGQDSIADIEPRLDMIFESEVAAYKFYNEYSKRIGFGIRREYENKSKKDGVLTSRRFTCYKQGTRSVDERRQLTGESMQQPLDLNSISLNGTHHQASIQGTQSSQADNGILCQTAIQGTESSEVDNGAQCQATIQGAQ